MLYLHACEIIDLDSIVKNFLLLAILNAFFITNAIAQESSSGDSFLDKAFGGSINRDVHTTSKKRKSRASEAKVKDQISLEKYIGDTADPKLPFKDESILRLARQIIPAKYFDEFVSRLNNLGVEGSAAEISGSGCTPHACSVSESLYVIRANGEMFFVMNDIEGEGQLKYFANSQKPMPTQIQKFVDGMRENYSHSAANVPASHNKISLKPLRKTVDFDVGCALYNTSANRTKLRPYIIQANDKNGDWFNIDGKDIQLLRKSNKQSQLKGIEVYIYNGSTITLSSSKEVLKTGKGRVKVTIDGDSPSSLILYARCGE